MSRLVPTTFTGLAAGPSDVRDLTVASGLKRKLPEQDAVAGTPLETDESVAEKIRTASLGLLRNTTHPSPDLEKQHELSTLDFMNATIQEQIEYIKRPDWVKTHDNLSSPVLTWFSENSMTVARRTPARTATFCLTYGQRAAIYYLSYGSPVKVSYGYSIDTDAAVEYLRKHYVLDDKTHDPEHKQESIRQFKQRQFRLERMQSSAITSVMSVSPDSVPPVFRIACFPMGLGKTVITAFSAITALCTTEGRRISDLIYAQKCREPETGFRRETTADGSAIDQKRIAPLFVFFVPKHMEAHWEQTAYDCVPEVARLHQKGVFLSDTLQIWKGTPKAQNFSVSRCYEEGKPTLWILPLGTSSLDVLYASPDIAVSGVVYDEMDVNLTKMGNKTRSIVAGPVVVVQATVESLAVHFQSQQKNNFLQGIVGFHAMKSERDLKSNLRSGNYDEISRALTCSARLHMCMPPVKLMQMVAEASSHKMPRGITRHSVTTRKSIYDVLCYGNLSERDISSAISSYLYSALQNHVTATSQLKQKLCAIAYAKTEGADQVVDFEALREPVQKVVDEMYPTSSETHYDVLGLRFEDCWGYVGKEKLEAARKAARIKHHPDKNPDDVEGATRMFQKIEQAYDVLSNYVKKMRYDGTLLMARKKIDCDATVRNFFEKKISAFSKCDKCAGSRFRFCPGNDNAHCVGCHPHPVSFSDEISSYDFSPAETTVPMSGRDAVVSLLVQRLGDPKARVVLFCNQYSLEFLDAVRKKEKNLVVLTFPKGSKKDTRARTIAKFSAPHERHPFPMLMIMSKEEIRGSDLKNVTSVVVYGKAHDDERRQVIGRCLRMGDTPRQDIMIPVYEVIA